MPSLKPCCPNLIHLQELRTNLYTSFNIVHASIKAMLSEQHGGPNGGSVVLTSAAVASHGIPNFGAMAAAKAGVEGALLHSLASLEALLFLFLRCLADDLRSLTCLGMHERTTASSTYSMGVGMLCRFHWQRCSCFDQQLHGLTSSLHLHPRFGAQCSCNLRQAPHQGQLCGAWAD